MAKAPLVQGSIVDGYRLEERIHGGGMATLWRVSGSGSEQMSPLLMKIPLVSADADPAAIVSFEMEQLILPRLAGAHVPKFIAAGSFAAQPYIVMEQIPGATLLKRLGALPLPFDEVADLGRRIATAL